MARNLPEALRNCDALSFSQTSEAATYAGLHLLDRYGRVMQVLEYLTRIGRLPLRRVGIKVLEIGSGPAPALYAVHDFYSMLHEWPGRGSTEIAGVKSADSLERGGAWDPILHHISEHLMMVRGDRQGAIGLPFRRSIDDFTGFDTRQRHHQATNQAARVIFNDFDFADEPISMKTAFRLAYQDEGKVPSAYDLVFMCNFLTQQSMTEQFSKELQKLAYALTPGGVLVVMGATGGQYPAIYEAVKEIASRARLTDVSPAQPLDANLSPHLDIVSEHTRANVAAALADCSDEERHDICSKLPKDLWNPAVEFVLPKYQALVFAMQKKP
jgi:ribosomal protein RSM22 (predicted rRNA methylase)